MQYFSIQRPATKSRFRVQDTCRASPAAHKILQVFFSPPYCPPHRSLPPTSSTSPDRARHLLTTTTTTTTAARSPSTTRVGSRQETAPLSCRWECLAVHPAALHRTTSTKTQPRGKGAIAICCSPSGGADDRLQDSNGQRQPLAALWGKLVPPRPSELSAATSATCSRITLAASRSCIRPSFCPAPDRTSSATPPRTLIRSSSQRPRSTTPSSCLLSATPSSGLPSTKPSSGLPSTTPSSDTAFSPFYPDLAFSPF